MQATVVSPASESSQVQTVAPCSTTKMYMVWVKRTIDNRERLVSVWTTQD